MISARVKIQCSGKTQVGKEFGESKAEGRLTCQPQKPECLMRMIRVLRWRRGGQSACQTQCPCAAPRGREFLLGPVQASGVSLLEE